MSPPLLDTNDCNLQLWQAGQSLSSPGYALLNGNDYLFGQSARAKARLKPREVNTRFWWQLNTEALQPSLGPARHTADLVHAHLQRIHSEGGQPDELLLAVPGSASREQLALLLGIVQQCPFNAAGLVNRSVVLGSQIAGDGSLMHLEIQLHQALLTELNREQGEVSLVRSTALPGCGLLQLQDKLVEIIAKAFIRQTRFDPRRKADTEQQLFDSLPAALSTLRQNPEAFIEVQGYRTRVTADELEDASARLFSALRDRLNGTASGAGIIVDPLGALLPGLQRALPAMTVLEPDALFQAASSLGDHLIQRGDALSLTTSLPVSAASVTAAPAPAAPPAPEPAAEPLPEPASHALIGHTARPLHSNGLTLSKGCEIFRDGEGWYLRGDQVERARINGSPATGRAVGLGDRIQLEGVDEVLLISIEGAE